MVSSLIARRRARRKVGPERGAPITWMGWGRICLRGVLLVLLMLVCVPLHYLYRIVHYGSPFPKLFLFCAARIISTARAPSASPTRGAASAAAPAADRMNAKISAGIAPARSGSAIALSPTSDIV